MTVAHDKKFFDTFMLVLGILIGIAVILYVLARIVASDTQELEVKESPEMRRAINERIAPVAKVAVAGAGGRGARLERRAARVGTAALRPLRPRRRRPRPRRLRPLHVRRGALPPDDY